MIRYDRLQQNTSRMEKKTTTGSMSQAVEEDMKLLIPLLIALTFFTLTDQAFAHHKDGHDKGPPDDKGKPDDVPKGPKDKTVVSGASGCSRMWITNDPTAYARCTIIDVNSPTIQQVTILKSGKTCVYVTDDLGVKMVLIGNKVLDRFNYTDWFCGFGSFDYSVVIAVDYAANVGVKRI